MSRPVIRSSPSLNSRLVAWFYPSRPKEQNRVAGPNKIGSLSVKNSFFHEKKTESYNEQKNTGMR